MAVNGASKFMKGQVPVSNLNLINGDFGDDAGIFMENRDFCFVGKNSMKIRLKRNELFVFSKVLRMVLVVIVHLE